MNNIIDGLIASLLSNQFSEKYKRFLKSLDSDDNPSSPIKISHTEETAEENLGLEVFSVAEVEDILSMLRIPIAHFIVNTVPTGYFSVAAVIESQLTNEWYVIRSGEFALQGTGGGYRKFKLLLDILNNHDVQTAIWCSSGENFKRFMHAEITWLQLKLKIFPFLSNINRKHKGWREVVMKVAEFFPKLKKIIDHNLYQIVDNPAHNSTNFHQSISNMNNATQPSFWQKEPEIPN